MEESKKPVRSPNFSMSDALLLCEVMGGDSGVEGLSFHSMQRHKFTNTITSCSKGAAWKTIVQAFNSRADEPREIPSLKKKWDNLAQTHRSQYSDYLHSQQLTGGGPSCKKLSVVTEAVMAVIGRNACNTKGVVGSDLDTTQLQINNFK
ncbi:uncharacterized protein LOC123542664 isoform X1 [Mercenaria mercenaria]|uniref:uncharacterized protein LOC123542664 isoform X1 n=1 Tax=Mercenaria mercenaria TaxID=6596 RepID=UPI00234E52F9|nr:uncharacterized protein LOC123542664 isoform X1 [Mercenaria mercenaria]